MKFQKTLMAVAIAGIAAAPMIASADTTLSGVIEMQLKGSDADDVTDPVTNEVTSPGDLSVATGDVIVGIVSEHELNSGLTGYGSLRADIDQLSNAGSAFSADNIYAGIKGGFGDVRVGEIPLTVEYGQVANDIFDVGAEINGGVSYTGSFGPVGIGFNFSPENNSDAIGLGAKFGLAGFSIGVGVEDRAEAQNFSVGASYAIAGISLAAHLWTKEGADANGSDQESMSIKAGYGFGGVTAGLTFSTLTGDDVGTVAGGDEEAIRLDLGYGLGGGTEISTRITAFSGDTELTEYRVQLAKSF